MTTAASRPLSRGAEFVLALSAVVIASAGVPLVPVVNELPAVSVLAVVAGVAMLVHPVPGMVAVILGAFGAQFLRGPAPLDTRIENTLVFALLGTAVVAIAFTRRTKLAAAQQYLELFEHHPLPMWLLDEDSLVFLKVNEAAVKTYGYTRAEFARMTLHDIRTGDDRQTFNASVWAGTEQYEGTWRHRRKDGRFADVLMRCRKVALDGRAARLVLIEDISEQRSLEAQLRQAQKMDAVGQLAGGIAHDFNNLLTAIQGYSNLVFDSLPEYDTRRDDVQEITRASERAADLTRQLLAFSRKQIFEPRVLEPSRVVKELAPMLRRLVHENIEVTAVTAAKGHVKADPVQLQQVLMNLVVNARDAIGDGGGRITVETADVVLDETYTDTHAIAHTGPHVMMAVSDTGHGMDADTQARIFEPFFTTKPQGRGTGLGLSTVYGIVQQSGGHLWVYSEVGRGTTFKVYLPVTDEASLSLVKEPIAPVPHKAANILLLEDEDGVRRLVTKVLEKRGYIVHPAGRPGEALAIARREGLRIDLLLTDVVMPDMSGRAVADAVQAIHPHCRVLFMSGYTSDAIVRHGVLHAEALFLQKPFRADDLAQKVAEALAGKVAIVLEAGTRP